MKKRLYCLLRKNFQREKVFLLGKRGELLDLCLSVCFCVSVCVYVSAVYDRAQNRPHDDVHGQRRHRRRPTSDCDLWPNPVKPNANAKAKPESAEKCIRPSTTRRVNNSNNNKTNVGNSQLMPFSVALFGQLQQSCACWARGSER